MSQVQILSSRLDVQVDKQEFRFKGTNPECWLSFGLEVGDEKARMVLPNSNRVIQVRLKLACPPSRSLDEKGHTGKA